MQKLTKVLHNRLVRYGGNASDERDFIEISATRKEAFIPGTLRLAFRNCGIWPFNPSVVITKLERLDSEADTGLLSISYPSPSSFSSLVFWYE